MGCSMTVNAQFRHYRHIVDGNAHTVHIVRVIEPRCVKGEEQPAAGIRPAIRVLANGQRCRCHIVAIAVTAGSRVVGGIPDNLPIRRLAVTVRRRSHGSSLDDRHQLRFNRDIAIVAEPRWSVQSICLLLR